MQTSAAGLKPQTEELNGWKDTEIAKEKEHYRQNTGMVECGTHTEGYRCAHCGVSKRQKLKYYLGYAHKYFINSLSDLCEKEVHFIN